MVREEKNKNTTHFFTTSSPEEPQHEEEFDEFDVVWSDTNTDNNNETTSNTTTSVSSPRGYTAGISAALLGDNEPRSPTSFQRKTTSSPVSMISSSFTRSPSGPGTRWPGPGPRPRPVMVGYGRNFSAPVNVPVWPTRLRSGPGPASFGLGPFDEVDDEGWGQDDGEMVPPHEIVARSHGGTSFSVFEGAGRTLKGRDLTAVRNAVFQKTGFLD